MEWVSSMVCLLVANWGIMMAEMLVVSLDLQLGQRLALNAEEKKRKHVASQHDIAFVKAITGDSK